MSVEIEVKKVDAQGRLILPSDWREDQLKGSNVVHVIKRRGYLKIVPKRKIGLGKFFDRADPIFLSLSMSSELRSIWNSISLFLGTYLAIASKKFPLVQYRNPLNSLLSTFLRL